MHPTLPLSSRRKVIFLYHSLQASGPAFQWACDHVFRPGSDHVTILNVFTDEAFQVVDAKKLWQVATEQITVEVEYKKKLDRVEQEMEILRATLASQDILARKVVMPEGDAKANILKVARSLNAELVVLNANIITPFQRAVHGSLEDHLLRNGDFSVIIAKPKSMPIAPKPRRDSGFAVSAPNSPPQNQTQPQTQPQPEPQPEIPTKPIATQKTLPEDPPQPTPFPCQVAPPSPPESEIESDFAHDSDEEPSVLATFREQLEAYQSKASMEDWDLPTTVPSDRDPDSDSGQGSPREFRPRPPQPRVRSIIETLPCP